MTLTLAVVPPIPADHLLVFLLQLGGLLVVALGLGRLMLRFGLPVVVGELLAGVLVGPTVLGHLAPPVTGWLLPARADQMHLLDAVSQLGALLLVGVAGAGMDTRGIGRRRLALATIAAGSLAVPLGIGIGTGFLTPPALIGPRGDRLVFALFLGVVLGVSAIPVIAKTLADLGLLHRSIGQMTLAVAAVDDALSWLLLSAVSLLAAGGPVHPAQFGRSVAYLLGLVVAAIVIARPVTQRIMRAAVAGGDPGPISAAAVIMIMLGAASAVSLGLEAVFGAFLAGIVIASCVRDAQLLAPLRTVTLSVFAPIFLATAGLRIDLTTLADRRTLLAAVVIFLLAVVTKVAGAYAGARLARLTHWEGLAVGAGLNARGAVEIVIATIGVRLQVISTAMYTIVMLVAVLTSIMAGPMLRLAIARVDRDSPGRARSAEPFQRDPAETDEVEVKVEAEAAVKVEAEAEAEVTGHPGVNGRTPAWLPRRPSFPRSSAGRRYVP